MKKLIVGCGYLGRRVAELWRQQGDTVHAVTRSAERARQFERDGLLPIVADVTQPASLAALPQVDAVLYAVGFDRRAGLDMRRVYVDGLQAVLNALPLPRRFIYVSSTGVYGQCDGGWIDEASPTVPTRENGRICLDAEERLQSQPIGQRTVILRLAGIYGPGRVPNRDLLLRGEALQVDPQGYLNLIHVEDAAQAVLAAERLPFENGPRLYLISDGQSVMRGDYYREAARLLGAPPPTFVTADAANAAAAPRRGDASRRVNNARMRSELGVAPRFPSYKEGLAAELSADGA